MTRRNLWTLALVPIGIVAGTITCGIPVVAQQATTAPSESTNDIGQLFASTCGYCHSNGGRSAGKGPQLMGTTLTDAEIASRIKNGKPGAMPAFGGTFSDDDIKAIIRYIRDLKES